MRLSLFTGSIILLLVAPGFHARARAQQRNSDSSAASISGRVTIEGKPASGVVVVLRGNQGGQEQRRFVGTTDAEGRFNIVGVAPGGYEIAPHAYAFVLANQAPNIRYSERIVVGAGETLDDVSIEMVRGSVVTGRVIDEDGHPVIGGHVSLKKLRHDGMTHTEYVHQPLDMGETDDRGVYRLFGVPAGRYLVRVSLVTAAHGNRGNYSVFYPNTRDESKAKVIEVSAGEEKTDVNITTVPPEKTYTASGRLIDAATGKPVPDVYIECRPLDGNYEKMGMVPNSVEFRNTESDGRFRLVGLRPGQYRLSISPMSNWGIEWYCDDLTIDVADEDLGGIELKAHRGASISGVVTVESANDPQMIASLVSSTVGVAARHSDGRSGGDSRIGANSRFHVTGLRPGEFQLSTWVSGPSKKRLSMQRLEMAGQPVRDTVELKEGQSISDARIVMVYGDGVVRGQVKFQNGELPKNACFFVQTSHRGECSSCESVFFSPVSAGGQYTLEGLPPGEYELTLSAHSCGAGNQPQIPPVKQTIRVANEIETRADFVVDLNKKNQ